MPEALFFVAPSLAAMSNGLQLSGLVSGFDWKSFVDTMISLERTPAQRMEIERITNNSQITALSGVETRLGELRTAVKALGGDAFDARGATGTDSLWQSAASGTTPVGTYNFEVINLATAARLQGATARATPIAPTADVSGVTLSTLGTGLAVTAGEFTVNGTRIAVDLSDSLQDVFDNIASATGGAVTASYDSATDRVTFNSAQPIMLGSANDTSNLLAALRFTSNGANSLTSAGSLGAVNLNAGLPSSRLATAITNADVDGNATFSLNGVSFSYNVNDDSLAAVLERVNASEAGVEISYDALEDRFSLINRRTGDLGVSATETGNGLLQALGLTTGATLVRGDNASFRVNGGPVRTSADNTFTAESHGIAGLSVTPRGSGVNNEITVAPDTTSMRAKIDTFITKFNAVQSYIDDQSRVTSVNGKVTTSVLSNNREVQSWAGSLRSTVFAAVPGLSETLSRLDHLGIDFNSGTSNLAIKNETALTNALRDRPDEVKSFFTQASTGFLDRLETLFSSYLGNFGGGGLLAGQKNNLTKQNDSIALQIADIDRRLVQRRATLESAFIAMENAQAMINQMQSQLTNAFPNTGSNANKK